VKPFGDLARSFMLEKSPAERGGSRARGEPPAAELEVSSGKMQSSMRKSCGAENERTNE
jgi:hypothetical protein